MFNIYEVTVACSNDYSKQFNFDHKHIFVAVDMSALQAAIRTQYNFANHAAAGSKIKVGVKTLSSGHMGYKVR